MTHFYGTEKELNLWLAQKTEKALADVALGRGIDVTHMPYDTFIKHTEYAKV